MAELQYSSFALLRDVRPEEDVHGPDARVGGGVHQAGGGGDQLGAEVFGENVLPSEKMSESIWQLRNSSLVDLELRSSQV